MHYNERQTRKSLISQAMILKEIIFNRLQNFLCKVIATLFFIISLSASLSVDAADQHGPATESHSGGQQTRTSSKKKSDAYSGWEIYQTSKSMGTNKLILCAAGMKIVNPLMSMAYWPKTNQLVMINNSNHKYFLCTKEKFPHYVKMLGFDIFGTASKDLKYSDWKKIDTEQVASMNCVLYQRQAFNMPGGAERKEQTWVSSEISLPETAFQVYSELSGRPDSCRFGFPMKSKVITNTPPDGFKVRVDFDTREVAAKQFTASDFLMPKDYILVKEFSEFLLNDSESKMAKTKAFADRANEPAAPKALSK
jgi:hypothetical protein